MPVKKDFATSGTESFKLNGHQEDDHIVLNIEEEKSVGIVLDEVPATRKAPSSGGVGKLFSQVNLYLVSKSGVKVKDKANFFHLLSVMINAGIPMVKALKSLVAQLDDTPKLQLIIRELAEGIENGSSLSETMLPYDNVFSEAEIGMVRSGEVSGQLTRVLDNLSDDAEKAYSIKSKIKGAMMYPLVIFSLLIVVVIGMLVFVIPKLTELFSQAGGNLPLVTKIVVGASDFLVGHTILLLAMVIALVAGLIIFGRTEPGRYIYDKIKISIPIFGPLFKKAYLSRFARSLSNLLDSNVSILRTIEITANSIGNEVYRKRLLLCLEDVKQGIPLAENLSSTDLFPPMLVNMIDVGEKTAQLDTITAKVAKFYEDEVDTAVAGISRIIEPVILIVIGLTVGVVVAAVMLPIMQLADLSGSL